VSIQIIPSIDISHGHAVKRVQGVEGTEVVKVSPFKVLENILAYRDKIRRIHIVDLDGAKEGYPKNFEIIKQIVESVQDIKIQVGGGIRKLEHALMYVKLGVDIVISSIVFKDFEEAKKIVEDIGPEKVFVSIDIKEGKIAISGWTECSVADVVDRLRLLDIENVIHTCVDVEGTLQGPRPYVDLINTLRKELRIRNLFYAGGVRDKNDVKMLEKFGFNGVIIGMAMYMKGLEHFLS